MLLVIADIETDLLTYADFEEVASVARAKLFITAAKRWLILRADSASSNSQSMSIGKQYVADMLTRAQAYVSANDTTAASGRTRFLHLGSFSR